MLGTFGAGSVHFILGMEAWCGTLYEPDAHYNVYGKRLTLEQYKEMMGQLFRHFTMELGAFENMIIRDNWCAIRYSVKIKNLHTGEEIDQSTMEFVQFKDNGGDIGVRVVEGWALSDSPLSASFENAVDRADTVREKITDDAKKGLHAVEAAAAGKAKALEKAIVEGAKKVGDAIVIGYTQAEDK